MEEMGDILHSASFYPVKVQVHLISYCFLLHNYIRNEMIVDPPEDVIDSWNDGNGPGDDLNEAPLVDFVEATTD